MLQEPDFSKKESELLSESKAWLEFGLPDEAIIDLNELPKKFQNTFPVLELKWQAYFLLKQFDVLKKIGALLTEHYKDNVQSWLLHAQSYHVTAEYDKALKILRPVTKKFCNCWDFAYDFACYHALTGDFSGADYWLNIARKHGDLERIKNLIKVDPDLKEYKEYLKKKNS